MSQRIHLNPNRGQPPMMHQGYQPDPIRTSSPGFQRSENELVAKIQEYSSKVEDVVDSISQVGNPSHGGKNLESRSDTTHTQTVWAFRHSTVGGVVLHPLVPCVVFDFGAFADVNSPSVLTFPSSVASSLLLLSLRVSCLMDVTDTQMRFVSSPSGLTSSGTSRSTVTFPGASATCSSSRMFCSCSADRPVSSCSATRKSLWDRFSALFFCRRSATVFSLT